MNCYTIKNYTIALNAILIVDDKVAYGQEKLPCRYLKKGRKSKGSIKLFTATMKH